LTCSDKRSLLKFLTTICRSLYLIEYGRAFQHACRIIGNVMWL